MRSTVLALVLVLAPALSCRKSSNPAPPVKKQAHKTTRARDGAPAKSDASDASRCAAIQKRFRATLTAASNACQTATDCACYNPVVGEAGCGGVTDAATAKKLRAVEADFHAAGCRWPHECAATRCAPRCVQGACAE